jgi:formylmethanofuran dehydrogenase subunit E
MFREKKMNAQQLMETELFKRCAEAKIESSEACEQCGEPTMRTKLVAHGNHKFCRDCFDKSRKHH